MVALNSYLPGLARSSPEVVAAKEELERLQSDTGNGAAYKEAQQAFNAVVSRSTAQTSSKGIAIGYTGGITLLLIALVPLTMMHGSTFSLRLGIAMSGIWWLLFTIPAAAWLPGGFASLVRFTAKDVQLGREEEREGLLPSESSVGNALIAAEQPWSLWVAIKNSWRGLAAMLRPSEARRLRNTFWYLAAWFLLSDGMYFILATFLCQFIEQHSPGFTSITSTAMLFGKTTLHIPSTHLVFMGVLAPASGIGGSLLWPRLQKRMGWSNIRTLVMLVAAAAMVPLYGCLGALIWLKNAPWGGLRAPWEMWIAVIYFGEMLKLRRRETAQRLFLQRFDLWRFSRLRKVRLRGDDTAGRGSQMVRVVLDNRQGKFLCLLTGSRSLNERPVKFFPWTADRWSHSRRDWKYPVWLLLPCIYDTPSGPNTSFWGRCRPRAGRCCAIRSSKRGSNVEFFVPCRLFVGFYNPSTLCWTPRRL